METDSKTEAELRLPEKRGLSGLRGREISIELVTWSAAC